MIICILMKVKRVESKPGISLFTTPIRQVNKLVNSRVCERRTSPSTFKVILKNIIIEQLLPYFV